MKKLLGGFHLNGQTLVLDLQTFKLLRGAW